MLVWTVIIIGERGLVTMARTDSDITSPLGDAMRIVRAVATSRTVGVFIDQTMSALTQAVNGSLVSFSRLDLANQTATVALQPYRAEYEQGVEKVARLIDEHPIYQWYITQPDWSPVRLSDVTPWAAFTDSRLFKEVLAPIGVGYAMVIMLSPPAEGHWIYFALNRQDPDFTDDELALCAHLQALVALYAHLTVAGDGPEAGHVALTRRERTVLGYLADGLTAEAIAHRLSARPATVRKHLQNLYSKLGTSDRLGAVIRGRDLGLLGAEDLSREFTWNMRYDMRRFREPGQALSAGDREV